MAVKVSISAQQAAFARKLAGDGRCASPSTDVQRGLDLLRDESETREAERETLRALLRERAERAFVTADEGSSDRAATLAEKCCARGP